MPPHKFATYPVQNDTNIHYVYYWENIFRRKTTLLVSDKFFNIIFNRFFWSEIVLESRRFEFDRNFLIQYCAITEIANRPTNTVTKNFISPSFLWYEFRMNLWPIYCSCVHIYTQMGAIIVMTVFFLLERYDFRDVSLDFRPASKTRSKDTYIILISITDTLVHWKKPQLLNMPAIARR